MNKELLSLKMLGRGKNPEISLRVEVSAITGRTGISIFQQGRSSGMDERLYIWLTDKQVERVRECLRRKPKRKK